MTNQTKEHLLCFDAKIKYPVKDFPLTEDALNAYLLKSDISAVVSVENASLFNPNGSFYQKNAQNLCYANIENGIPDEHDINSNRLWVDLDQLNNFLQYHKTALSQDIYTVAITVIEELSSEEKSDYGKYQAIYEENKMSLIQFPPDWETNPTTIDKHWKFLGYDIVEADLGGTISGLSNCGYYEEEKTFIQEKNWANHLNTYHLFDSLDIAIQFKNHTNNRVSEHAPFLVFGIYLIGEACGDIA